MNLGALEVVPAYPACLPFCSINPNITTVGSRNSTGKSHYNAGQFELDKRAGRGLTLTAAYNWSKMMDNINNPIDSYATKEELDTANWQRNNYPQAIVFSYVYELPFGKNKEWLNSTSSLANAFIGGWGISGITSFRSGAPLLIPASAGDLLPQNVGQRADRVCTGQTNPRQISTSQTAWAELSNLAVRQNCVKMRHNGLRESILTNQTGPALIWRAAFAGAYHQLLVDGKPVPAQIEEGPLSHPMSWVQVVVGAGDTVTAATQE